MSHSPTSHPTLSRMGYVLFITASLTFTACGGGGGGSSATTSTPTPITYTIGGSVSGLTGTLVLQNNGGDNLSVGADGSFTFASAVSNSSVYGVTILYQPSGQKCSVSNSTGTIATANISNVVVVCAFNLLGGAVQGKVLNLSAASAVTTVSTLTGTGVSGAADGATSVATFSAAAGMTTDGTNLYVVENCGAFNGIRKIVIATGEASTLAGSSAIVSADGVGSAAAFNCPWGITTDGNSLYVVDQSNNDIRKIAPTSGSLSAMTSANAVVTTLAGSGAAGSTDGTGTAASFSGPSNITTDGASLYVTDTNNHLIRKITPASGSLSAMTNANAVVTTLAGVSAFAGGFIDGTGTAAKFNSPMGITTDGTNLYVADVSSRRIRKITPASGSLSAMTSANAVVSTLAGSIAGNAEGVGTAASFIQPIDITTDGSHLYVVDKPANKIRMISPSSGTLSAMTSANALVSSVTGLTDTPVTGGAVNGPAASASFNNPWGIITDGNSLFVTEQGNLLIRKIQ